MRDFAGKTAVITGGASGIGRAMGERFLSAGMNVVLADVETSTLAKTVNDLGPLGNVIGVPTDVSSQPAVQALAAQTTRVWREILRRPRPSWAMIRTAC